MVGRASRHADASAAGLSGKTLGVGGASDLALSLGADFSAFLSFASDLRAGIGDEGRRALARVLMIFSQTDRVFSTDVGLTCVHARVGETVAILVGGAVVVLQTIDLLATRLVGIALVESVGTNALSDVVSGHADGSGSTFQELTRGLTSSASLTRSADLIFETLGIIFTFIGKCGCATSATFWIACVAFFAAAVACVLLGDALRACRARHRLADFDASFYSV